MEDRSQDQAPFDERAALEELEHLRGQIERYRAERKAAEQRFDRFIRSFKEPHQPAAAVRTRPVHSESPPGSPEVPPVVPEPVPAPSEPLPVPSEPSPNPTEPPAPAPARSRASSRTRALRGGALIVLVAAGLAAWTLRHRAPEPASPAPARPPSRAPEPPAAAAPAATAPSAAAPARNRSEITTLRRVWMRVIVDGQRVLEREVPADTRVPLTAEKTILIRTGDAGAVRLSIDGEDKGLLGREGEVVTRTFTVPAPPAR